MSDLRISNIEFIAKTDFDKACKWAEDNLPELKSFLSTWSKNCGAPRAVFVGHTVSMLIELNKGS